MLSWKPSMKTIKDFRKIKIYYSYKKGASRVFAWKRINCHLFKAYSALKSLRIYKMEKY